MNIATGNAYDIIYGGIAKGRIRAHEKNFFPLNSHVDIIQAVDTPRTNTPIETPINSFNEFNKYSGRTVSTKWIQLDEKSCARLRKIDIAGKEKIIATIKIGDKEKKFLILFKKYLLRRLNFKLLPTSPIHYSNSFWIINT